jgi:hypothetical protein
MADEKDHGGTSLTAGDAVSVSASDAASHAAPTHTPGPWLSFDSGTLVISASPGDALIADLDGSEVDTNEEREANAHLIAAAPELYAVVKAYVVACKEQDIKLGSITGDAIAALAKAEGRERQPSIATEIGSVPSEAS